MMMITVSFDLLLSIGMYGKEIASENPALPSLLLLMKIQDLKKIRN
jgi:hypothetical protein